MVLIVTILSLLPTSIENAYNEPETQLGPPQTIYCADVGEYEIRAIWIGEDKLEWVKINKKPATNENIKRSSKIQRKRRAYAKDIEHIRKIGKENR